MTDKPIKSQKTASDLIELPVLPLRDVVVFPHMVIPLFVGREKSVRALEMAMAGSKKILLVAQRSPDVDEPNAGDLYTIGTIASVLQLLKLPDGTIKVLVEGADRAEIATFGERDGLMIAHARALETTRTRSGASRSGQRAVIGQLVRTVGQALSQDSAGTDVDPGWHRGSIASGRHDRGAHRGARRRKAARAGNRRRRRPPGTPGRHDRWRDRCAADREAHPRPRQDADGEEPARVLPQRADEGDPEGTRRQRGRAERSRGSGQEDRSGRHAQAGRGQGARRAQQAQADVADVGRSHRRAQLHRLAGRGAVEEAQQGAARPAARPGSARRGPFRSGKGQGTHPRISRRAAARERR